MKLKFIYADTMGSNYIMKSIFEKFGFELVTIEEHYYDMHDSWEDKLKYLLRNPNSTKGE